MSRGKIIKIYAGPHPLHGYFNYLISAKLNADNKESVDIESSWIMDGSKEDPEDTITMPIEAIKNLYMEFVFEKVAK